MRIVRITFEVVLFFLAIVGFWFVILVILPI